jgi:DNA-directed RNA polymerase specialized sigma24 family protein
MGRPRTKRRRLSAAERQELVVRYRKGAVQRELAEIYGIARGTVTAIVRRHGAQRKFGLDNVEVEVALCRYEEGVSLATIGEGLGVDPSTVRNHLLKHGVELRDSHGRQRIRGSASEEGS